MSDKHPKNSTPEPENSFAKWYKDEWEESTRKVKENGEWAWSYRMKLTTMEDGKALLLEAYNQGYKDAGDDLSSKTSASKLVDRSAGVGEGDE